MVVSRQDSGRILQKRRTRLAIVVAAASLLAQGRRPTVAEAADAALVSRATAYRYFPSQGALLLEAALQSTHPEIAPALADAPADDVNARFDVVCTAMFERVIDAEPQLRQMLQITQQQWLDNSDVGRPRRSIVLPARTAASKSWVMPIESTGSARPSRCSASSRRRRSSSKAGSGSPSTAAMHMRPWTGSSWAAACTAAHA